MERIEEGQPFNVLVDYAHTDDALRNALGMLRAITPGRLLVVFGCGGNRDRTKRPLMTRAVQEFADFAFATADNPRTEAIAQIFDDMRAGVSAPEKITWIEDRRRAISLALDMAKPGDCLLIAGKGHESYQEFADTVFPFDDRQVVRELIGIKTLKTQGLIGSCRRSPQNNSRNGPPAAGRRRRLRRCAAFSFDTRKLRAGDMFVAIQDREARRPRFPGGGAGRGRERRARGGCQCQRSRCRNWW